MNRTRIARRVELGGVEAGATSVAARPAPASAAKGATYCAHCGERCADTAVAEEGRHFCCLGCRTVFALLVESGLAQFYHLAPTPGTRVRETTAQRQWAFLDEPAVREKLLNFSDARRASVTFHLPAIHCVACVWLLENLFRLKPGIGESRVNFSRREASITFAPDKAKLSEIASLLASLGYEPALTLGELDRAKESQTSRWRQRQLLQVGIAGFAFGNIMLLALPGYMGLDSLSGPWFKALAGWVSLALALPVLFYSAGDFWRAAWLSVRQRVLTLDVPIAFGLAAIYGQSLFEVTTGRGEGYCDSLTGLIFFLLCGRLFQRKTFDRLAFDRDYKGFFPLAVVRKTHEGEAPVAISELAVGDRLVIRHGELVPADARLICGDALVDYSFVTGESEPVTRHVGEHLHAGGRQVSGAIEVETVKPVSESYLTSLWNNKAFHKPGNEDRDSLTNLYSRRFTPFVIAIAVAAAVFWMFVDASVAMKAFTSVLIVACPCALALAAPLTLGTAQRVLSRQKVFVRSGHVIERMATVDTIVFDKTGTLTTAGTRDARWEGVALNDSEKRWVYSMTRHSMHPLATRVGATLRGSESNLVQPFVEIPGCGMNGFVAGREICMGSAAWLQRRGVQCAPTQKPNAQSKCGDEGAAERATLKLSDVRASDADGSTVHVAVDGRYRGCFVVESALRPEVDVLAQHLGERYQLILLSGDNAREAERFRSLLGRAALLEFNQTPFDKLNAIGQLQAAGRKVMMVGDGLNDAGALKQADIGVAVVEEAGAFSPASDVILHAAQLLRLAEALAFSRGVVQVVRTGFVLSGLYNAVGISIAAAGLLSPLVCAVLMPLSSATVVLFTVGATRWVARRTIAETNGLLRGARRPAKANPRLATSASMQEALR